MRRHSEIGRTTFAKSWFRSAFVVVALAALAPAPARAQAPTAEQLRQLENQVFILVNQRRAEQGLGAFTRAAELDAAGRRHSQNMATTGNFSHTGTDGSDPFDRIRAAGYNFTCAAENIAAGQDTADGVMTSWMNSTGHRANILSTCAKEIGISVVFLEGSEFRFYWTQVFGARDGAPAGGGGNTGGGGTTETGPTEAQLREKEVQLLDGINGDRSANGFDTLRRNSALDAAAKRHALDIAAKNLNRHTGSDGSQPWSRATDAGYTGTVLSTVLVGREAAAQILDDIWSNDNDFNNLFSQTAKDIGVALAFNGQASNRYFWVVVYGTP